MMKMNSARNRIVHLRSNAFSHAFIWLILLGGKQTDRYERFLGAQFDNRSDKRSTTNELKTGFNEPILSLAADALVHYIGELGIKSSQVNRFHEVLSLQRFPWLNTFAFKARF